MLWIVTYLNIYNYNFYLSSRLEYLRGKSTPESPFKMHTISYKHEFYSLE